MLRRLLSLMRRCHGRENRSDPSLLTKQLPEFATYSIGEFTYGRPKVLSWGEGAVLRIGNYCSIADEVTIFLGGEHRTDWISTYPFTLMLDTGFNIVGHPWTRGDVIIGNDVWIGRGATIRSGVHLGDGSVIGAGAFVVRNVEPYTIVAGNPAKTLRRRLPEGMIALLLDLRWWDWPVEHVLKVVPSLMSDDINALQQYAVRELGWRSEAVGDTAATSEDINNGVRR